MFEPMDPDRIFLADPAKIRKAIHLVREESGKKFYCLACVFELGDAVDEGNAIMSIGIASDMDDGQMVYQMADSEGFIPDIIEAFVERDQYNPTDDTRVVFRLFTEDKLGNITQIVFRPTALTATLLKRENN